MAIDLKIRYNREIQGGAFMDVPFNEIMKAFKKDYNKEVCQDFFNLTTAQLLDTKAKLESYLEDKEDLTSLCHYIEQDDVLAVFINDFIVNDTPASMVGSSIESEFINSIHVFERFEQELESQQGAIIIAPLIVVCPVIQNAYLFVNDMMEKGSIEDALERCYQISHETLDQEMVYHHLCSIILKPFYEIISYHLEKPNLDIPQYLVSSFGKVKADYALTQGNQLIDGIEKSLNEALSNIDFSGFNGSNDEGTLN